MNTEAVATTALAPAVPVVMQARQPGHDDLLAAFLAGKSPRTLRAYRADLVDFQMFTGAANPGDAARLLITSGHGAANLLALQYRASLEERKLSPATINRRLAALRSLCDVANILGLINWRLDVQNLRSQAYRDTKGPGLAGFKALLGAAAGQRAEKAARDTALLWLLYCPALRRAELESLDLEHFDQQAGTLNVLGKGRREREAITVPPQPLAALKAWLNVRGSNPGPLFLNCDRAKKGSGRLTADGVYRVVRRLGEKAAIKARPHGLRHAGITSALDLTHGDVRAVQKFSRHRDLRTLTRYDDNRADLGGNVATLVAAGVIV